MKKKQLLPLLEGGINEKDTEIHVINGCGLDLLEEAGIHICEKPTTKSNSTSPITMTRKKLLYMCKDAEQDNLPKEMFDYMFKPVIDVLDLAEKLEE